MLMIFIKRIFYIYKFKYLYYMNLCNIIFCKKYVLNLWKCYITVKIYVCIILYIMFSWIYIILVTYIPVLHQLVSFIIS